MVFSLPSLFVLVNLGEGRHSVCPGLNLCPDAFIRIGCEGQPSAAERYIEQFAVCVMAPDGRTVRFVVGITDGGAAVCSGDWGTGEQCSCACIETVNGAILV